MSSFRDDESPVRRSSDNSLFLWTVAILLLIGFAFFCWIFSFYVFGHPEKAFSYSILSKLKKIEPLKRFEITDAPRGEFLTAAKLSERYGTMSDRELARASEILLRNYIRNFKLTKDLVPYIVGSFNILDSYELKGDSVFPSGVLALAQSTSTPGVLIEHVFCAEPRVMPSLQRMLLTGLDLKLERSADLSAIIDVARLPDGRLLFTAVPLLYGSYTSSSSAGVYSLEPPAALLLQHPLPILTDRQVEEATKKYTAYRNRVGLNRTETASASGVVPTRETPQLMRVARPEPPPGSSTTASSTPAPAPSATPVAPPDDLPVRPALPVTAGTDDAPAAVPVATPVQQVAAATGGSTWPTFAPGQMPRGKLSGLNEMENLASTGLAGERIYLQGDFVVTAAGQNRAVLRMSGTTDPTTGGNSSNTRVIVEFPNGSQLPPSGATFQRDSRRPFLITDVKKGADGQINVFVREITSPE